MKMSKGKKRFLIACAAVLVAGITLAVTLMNDIADVVATQKVFDGMRTNFSTLKQVNILEIVPTSDRYTGQHDGKNYDLNTKSELGYFMPLSISNKCGTYNASDMAGASKMRILSSICSGVDMPDKVVRIPGSRSTNFSAYAA